MILLPRSWRIAKVRSVVTGLAWLFVLTGLYGAYHEACSTAGWGSYILIGLGSLVVALLAATEDGMSWSGRALWLVVALLTLPLSLMFVAMFQDLVRGACAA